MILLPQYNLPYLHIIGPTLLRSPMMNAYMNSTPPTPTKLPFPPPASVQVKMRSFLSLPFFSSSSSSSNPYLFLFFYLILLFVSLGIFGVFSGPQYLLQSVTIPGAFSSRHPHSHSILRN